MTYVRGDKFSHFKADGAALKADGAAHGTFSSRPTPFPSFEMTRFPRAHFYDGAGLER
jgi:hypothetical protein